VVDSLHVYSDLDNLIVNHVQAVARRVVELVAHEKFNHGSEDELRRSRRLWSTTVPTVVAPLQLQAPLGR
jgi:hypothetical protein